MVVMHQKEVISADLYLARAKGHVNLESVLCAISWYAENFFPWRVFEVRLSK